jgi:hypothetical protein
MPSGYSSLSAEKRGSSAGFYVQLVLSVVILILVAAALIIGIVTLVKFASSSHVLVDAVASLTAGSTTPACSSGGVDDEELEVAEELDEEGLLLEAAGGRRHNSNRNKPCSCSKTERLFDWLKAGIHRLFRLVFGRLDTLLLAANQTSACDGQFPTYPYIRVTEGVFTDNTRLMSNGFFLNGTLPPSNDTFRRINYIVFQPASGPGSGPPISISVIPPLYNGALAGVGIPLVTSFMRFYSNQSWADNTPLSGPFPVVFMPERTVYSESTQIAERIASSGFIVVTFTSHGVTGPCTVAPFCVTQSSRNIPRDARALKNAAKAGQLLFSVSSIRTLPSNPGRYAFGCVGSSLAGQICAQACAGTIALITGSPPTENAPDYDFSAMIFGDAVIGPNPTALNLPTFNASLGIWSSSIGADWIVNFPRYFRNKVRVFWDVRAQNHGTSSAMARTAATVKELIRVRRAGIATTYDGLRIGTFTALAGDVLAHGAPDDLKDWQLLPFNPVLVAASLETARHRAPTTGLGSSDLIGVGSYYWGQFFRATLYESACSLQQASVNVNPRLLAGVYLNSTPLVLANNFALRGKQLQIDLDATQQHYRAITYDTTGTIAVPAGSVQFSSFSGIGAAWDDTARTFNLSFALPLKKPNIATSTRQVFLSSNGHIALVGGSNNPSSALYGAAHQQRIFEDIGYPVVACLHGDLRIGNATLGQDLWILNNAQEFTVTGTGVFAFALNASVNFQCSLYPNGTARIIHDTSIPAVIPTNGPFSAITSPAFTVGYTSGRSHVNADGNFDVVARGRTTPITAVLTGGEDGYDAEAILETFNGRFDQQIAGVNGASVLDGDDTYECPWGRAAEGDCFINKQDQLEAW